MQVNMKLFIVLTFFAFITVAKGAVTECYSCLEMNTPQCDAKGVMFDCSNDTFPNVGNTHCYTASAYYMQGGQKLSRVARGCGNCSDAATMTAEATERFKSRFDAQLNATLDVATINIICCDNANNCNNQTVSPSSSATSSVVNGSSQRPSTTPTSHATRLFPISGIMAFVPIILTVTL